MEAQVEDDDDDDDEGGGGGGHLPRPTSSGAALFSTNTVDESAFTVKVAKKTQSSSEFKGR